MPYETILFRFALAFVAAFTFGLVRQKLGKPIGFGTFIFLALGSCALALTAISSNPENPLPLLGSIVTGIGFLGAGALFRTGERVVGFTSAATIWIFAVLGLSIGVGEYLVSGLVYASIWSVVVIDRVLEKRWIGAHQHKLRIEVPLGTSDDQLQSLGLPERIAANLVTIDREKGSLVLSYSIDRPSGQRADVMRELEASELVKSASLES